MKLGSQNFDYYRISSLFCTSMVDFIFFDLMNVEMTKAVFSSD